MNKKGFLLFEVMISIVIVAAGLLFIMHSFSSAKNSIRRSGDIFKTALLLEDKFWQFEESGEIQEGVYEGDFTGDEDYSWKIDARALDESEQNVSYAGLELVTLEVFQKKSPDKTKYLIETYLKSKIE
ncbi:MAG: hypothetical protein ABIH57_00180 [Candidatus Omnitrophota bacterium]